MITRQVKIDSADLDAMITDMERADPQYATLEERGLLERLRAVQKHPRCCEHDCPEDAEFSIHGSSGHFEDVTEACAEHVGKLLGTPTWLLQGGKEENEHWTVHPIVGVIGAAKDDG